MCRIQSRRDQITILMENDGDSVSLLVRVEFKLFCNNPNPLSKSHIGEKLCQVCRTGRHHLRTEPKQDICILSAIKRVFLRRANNERVRWEGRI